MYARTLSLVFAMAMLLFMGSCGGTKRTIDRDAQMPVVTTPDGWKVSFAPGINYKLAFIDDHVRAFAECYQEKLGKSMDRSRLAPYVITVMPPGGFVCKWHKRGCYAEISYAQRTIWIARLKIGDNWIEHELGHLYDLMNSDDSLTPEGKRARCFPI